MSPDRWQQISQVYHAALTREEGERTAFVREACAGDEALRCEVESLLAQTPTAEGFLSTPAAAVGGMLSDSQPTMLSTAEPHGAPGDDSCLVPGQQLGPYRIERLLGRGGMGEVYEAEHLEHGRRIALKVLGHGLSDATDRARFLREGQLAATVSHPHTVYIYGSEEIAGIPVIAMELLSGGTLKDRVEKNGPLVPFEAIEAILQVVSGLEAARLAGILHRDIKPSNCFVDADGTVKIGDFGLSIPILARDVNVQQLTATGTVHATPQFASPEQLRGQPLDVRSDIYAVGATLYYLLTGRPPFEDRNLLALVSRIATELPRSPQEVRPQIPRALAALVVQCLAKDRAHRPASYDVLVNVLEPLSSTVKTPAPLGIRSAAGGLDKFFSKFLLVAPIAPLVARPSSVFGVLLVVTHLFEVAYFAITESVWGASLGKALCGFRVVTENGARPRFARALLRALVFVLPGWFASGLVLLVIGLEYSQRPVDPATVPMTVFVVEHVVVALLFVTARRANGLAGIHEWASHTRTVLTSAVEVRRPVGPVPGTSKVVASQQWIGPYRLVDIPGSPPSGGAALGYDERLQRMVWLRFPGVDSAPVPQLRRGLRRPARPRWLAGQRTEALAWDAFEQVPGQAFDTLVKQAQSWGRTREWIRDLAEEVDAGLRDGSLPPLELDRVWIGDDGRARLLDWPASNDRRDLVASQGRAVDFAQAQQFLHRVAQSALEGSVLARNQTQRPTSVLLPVTAADCLAKLGEHRFMTSEEMLAALSRAARGPAALSRTRRLVHLSLCAIPPVLALVLWFGNFVYLPWFVAPRQTIIRPDIAELVACLGRLAALERVGVPPTNIQYRALEVYLAGRHRDLISDSLTWSAPGLGPQEVSGPRRALAERVIAAWPNPQEADVADAVRILSPLLDSVRPLGIGGPSTAQLFWVYAIVGLVVAGASGLFSAVVGRGGIALRLMNIAVVARNGTVASGSRALLRSVLSWFPVAAAAAAVFAGRLPLLTLSPALTLTPTPAPIFGVRVMVLPRVFFSNQPSIPFVREAIITVALALFALSVVAAVIRPERGLQDRLSGTWLVPR